MHDKTGAIRRNHGDKFMDCLTTKNYTECNTLSRVYFQVDTHSWINSHISTQLENCRLLQEAFQTIGAY